MPKTSNWTRMQDEETKVRRYIWRHDEGNGYVTVIWKSSGQYNVVHHFDLKDPTRSINQVIAKQMDNQRVARNRAVEWMENHSDPKNRPPKMY